MSVLSYPAHLVSEWRAPDGTLVTIRPIRPEDATIERAFFDALTPEARYLRFMSSIKELTAEMLWQFTHVDYDRDMALIAVIRESDREVQIAVARYVTDPDEESCEFAVVVAERWRGMGLGVHLMQLIIDIARAGGIRTITGLILASNSGMLSLAKALGFTIVDNAQDFAVKRVQLKLV
jgi:acetyltransferase